MNVTICNRIFFHIVPLDCSICYSQFNCANSVLIPHNATALFCLTYVCGHVDSVMTNDIKIKHLIELLMTVTVP